MLKLVKSYSMPISMLTGVVFYPFFSRWVSIIPCLIFTMLFLTYSRINFQAIRIEKMHLWLMLIQLLGSVGVFFALRPIHPVLAQGAMVCVLAPTATSAPVITKILKGNVESLTAYSLFCNMFVLIGAPFFFALINDTGGQTFVQSFFSMLKHTIVLLLIPFLLALLIRKFAVNAAQKISNLSEVSFYLWSISLIVVTAKTVMFITLQDVTNRHLEIVLAVAALVICMAQFFIGRYIGRQYGNTVAGGQGLGQKNTVLAIWMAQTFFHPLSSIAPGAYVIWQNTFNSYQVWKANQAKPKEIS